MNRVIFYEFCDATKKYILCKQVKPTKGGFHKPIYTLCQALTLYAKLLHLKKGKQKLGVEPKSLV